MKRSQPNILLLVGDQHRWDCVGAARRYAVPTPHLDLLAASGAFFEHAFTPTPVCAPARQAMLSGLAPESYGALWNPDFIPTPTLAPDPHYAVACLERAGYRCSLVGKWNSSLTHRPADFGFADHLDLTDQAALVAARYPGLSWARGWLGEPSPVDLAHSKTHWAARLACDLMEDAQHRDRPWLIRVDFSDPHLPCRPSQPFAGLAATLQPEPWDSFGDDLTGKPYIQRQQIVNWRLQGFTWANWQETVALYQAMIAQLDDAVGLMLSRLDQLGLSDETVVIYTSDHGDLCGGHGMLDKHYVLYDDVIRVPLIVRYPARVPAGLRIDAYVSQALDLGATLADLCAIDDVKPGHGRSWWPLLQGGHEPDRDWAVASGHGQQFGLYTQRCLRTKAWHYVWNLTDIDELYDVRQDPGQKHNLIGRPNQPAVLPALRRRLYDELVRRQDPFVRADWVKDQLLCDRKIPDSNSEA